MWVNAAVLRIEMNINRRQNRNLTPEESAQAVVLAEEGRSQRYIAERLGVNQATISRVLRRFQETNIHTRRPGQGRRRATSAVQDRFLMMQTLRERFITAPRLQNMLEETHNIHVSAVTIRHRLREFNLAPRRPATGPMMTADHRRARLAFAREHVNWMEEDWASVLFSDESRFCLYNSDRRIRVYRRQGERYAQCNIVPTVLYGMGRDTFRGTYRVSCVTKG